MRIKAAAAAAAARWERPDIYKGTRGETLMVVDGEELKALAETILKVRRPSAPHRSSRC
jgi:hypothetical protein